MSNGQLFSKSLVRHASTRFRQACGMGKQPFVRIFAIPGKVAMVGMPLQKRARDISVMARRDNASSVK